MKEEPFVIIDTLGEEEQHCDWCKENKFDMPEGFDDLFKGFTK